MGGKDDKKGGAKIRVIDYLMSIHYGICWGPVDALLGIYIKERDAWPGKTEYDEDEDQQDGDLVISFKDFVNSLDGSNMPTGTAAVAVKNGPLKINRPDLFGGEVKEGGVEGTAYFLNGKPNQKLPDYLAQKLGLSDGDNAPGYRGITSVWFHGKGKDGFMWCQNNPYLPPAWFTIFRQPRPPGLTTSKAIIQRHNWPPDANPAYIIMECLTDTDWGMGAPTTIIDIDSFQQGGNKLYQEKFGLSMLWNEQATIESFVKEVLDHIQAALYVNPRTGLLTLKLFRPDDYNPDAPEGTYKTFGPSNSEITNRQRKAWSDTINEIVVTWTNPTNEEEETATFHDIGNIAEQGGIVSDSRNYYGIRNGELAAEVGARDIRVAAYPLWTGNVEASREAWDVVPGEIVFIEWPDDGIVKMVCRVGKVEYGKIGSMTIKFDVTEDVFSLGAGDFDYPDETSWEDPSSSPKPMANYMIFTVPYPVLVANGLDTETGDSKYPRVIPALFARQDDPDTFGFEIWGDKHLLNGDTVVGKIGTGRQNVYSKTKVEFQRESITNVNIDDLGTFVGAGRTGAPKAGSLLYIGTGDERRDEIAMVQSINSSGDMVIHRGLWDTVPRYWPVNTRIWYSTIAPTIDAREHVDGETVEFQLLTQTSLGRLPLTAAPVISKVLTGRPYYPFRPANVKVGGDSIFSIPVDGKTWTGTVRPTTIPVTWSTRNRKTEDQNPLKWTDASVTPEAGETTTIKLIALDGSIIHTYSGLAGTSANVNFDDFQGHRRAYISVFSARDGFESLQGVEFPVYFNLFGYGNNYGNDYGQNDG